MIARITYVARCFLDYRVPVLVSLDKLTGGNLYFITSDKWTPPRVLRRIKEVLGNRAIILRGEKSIGVNMPIEANTTICLPYQPGLVKAIRKTHSKILIGDGFFQWTYSALWHRIFFRIPLVVCYERWAHTERHAQWFRKLYRRFAMNFVDAVCCNGRLCLEYTESLGMPRERMTSGHMTADIDDVSEKAKIVSKVERDALRASWESQGLVYLYVGRLIGMKGVHQLLKGWTAFEKHRPKDGTLLLVGGGPEELLLKRHVTELRLRNVRFVGPVDYSLVPSYYAAADVFIIPTLEDNWSLVVPEAMACGLPILCSKYNGCWPELVHENRNGWVFDPLNPKDILRVLELCVLQKDRLPEMGNQSQDIVADHTPQRAAEAIYAACQIALSRR